MAKFSYKKYGEMPDVDKAKYLIIARAVAEIHSEASRNAPYDTGTLRRSLLMDIKPDKGKVGSNLPYAKIQEFGGTIVPKKKKLLMWKKGGKWHFAKKVTIKGRPYLIPAYEKIRDKMGGIITSELDKTTK